jgi:hypothetical protein
VLEATRGPAREGIGASMAGSLPVAPAISA